MLHINKIEPFYEPRKNILPQLGDLCGEPEMSESESAFLCGLIKKHKPKKIVEVGIAGGATSAIILECIKQLNLEPSKLYSIDYLKSFYRHPEHESGYLADIANQILFNDSNIHYEKKLGKIACTYEEEIKDIDLLLIDTTHSLPGELLDLVTLLPLVKNGGVVIFHDIALNHMVPNGYFYYATTVAFSSIVAEKYINLNTLDDKWSNIGAFIVDENTRQNITNLFLSMMISWNYMPDEQQLKDYFKSISMHYDQIFIDIYNKAVLFNKSTIKKRVNGYMRYLFPFDKVKKASKVVLVGAGMACQDLKKQIEKSNYCDVVSILDNDISKHNEMVRPVEEIIKLDYDYVIITVQKDSIVRVLKEQLLNLGVCDYKMISEKYNI